ncbi:N-hydroxyarylamine O-acetyltransferase [Roseibium hamelinense]|uniref:N-hydroxyarylamine O-acetyltransferase n=1 Tax=Roseibium hamelinense TaxID=150831 RepID=A0A562T9M9_9HYPH|nr:arylamine N-acetyltransferase [Roseibium hamelinense]MTI45358.1 arylamine N-acetyltransferase [Roseibium hamelinense]TWI90272.1 N-hydroxyarylamine O-acetyltransferase [Roseibium hamelinense]
MTTDFDLSAYLARVGLEPQTTGRPRLDQLQQAQIRTIPFENILPFLGRVPETGPADVFAKLVPGRCGGFCFELNTLFAEALTALDFSFRPVMARVRMGAERGGARTHLAFVVDLDGDEWLADTGFGGQGPALPLRLAETGEQTAGGKTYRIHKDDAEGEQVLEVRLDGDWFPLYGFDRVPVKPGDIEAATFVCALSPRQSFRNTLKAFRRTETGTVSFLDGRARWTGKGDEREEKLCSARELISFMHEDMGLAYPEENLTAAWDRLQDLHTQQAG